VVSNASAWHTFHKMLGDDKALAEYKEKMAGYSVSLSCLQVFLGLKTDLARKLGVSDSEVFVDGTYDPEASYAAALKADVEKCGLGIMLYDNVLPVFSPRVKRP
jgi:hypothetical protein